MSVLTARVPCVMVSSTFYDLRQIREDLRRFIDDELGYQALLSEHPSFPIDPDATTVENCRKRVEHDADVLVLIIGRRYGSVDDSTKKSVTNIEYLAARSKGIPIYAFAESGLLALLPVWRLNREADFSAEVDTPELLEFLELVRTADSTWTQEFRYARDIVDTLKMQFAYQHRRGLQFQHRMRKFDNRDWLQVLNGETLRLALERPPAWEYLFFASALTDAIRRHDHLRRRHQLRLPLGPGDDIVEPIKWIQARFRDARRIAESVTELFSGPLQTGLAAPGQPSDLETLWFVAETLGDLYRTGLIWSARLRTANVDERFGKLASIVAGMLDEFLNPLERFGPEIKTEIESALSAPSTSEPRKVRMTLVISISDSVLSDFDQELERLREEDGL